MISFSRYCTRLHRLRRTRGSKGVELRCEQYLCKSAVNQCSEAVWALRSRIGCHLSHENRPGINPGSVLGDTLLLFQIDLLVPATALIGSVVTVGNGVVRRIDTGCNETTIEEQPVDFETTIGAARYRWHRQTRGASDTSFAWKS